MTTLNIGTPYLVFLPCCLGNNHHVCAVELRAAVSIPVVANGGVRTREEADRMLQKTGCHGVMVGTALLINPRLFAEPPCERHTIGRAISVALEYLQFAELHPPRPIVLRKHFWHLSCRRIPR